MTLHIDKVAPGTILEGGAVLELNPTVQIVDVISPKISFTDEQIKSIEIEGILPELTLLSGSVKDQVSGNSNDPAYNSYYFPDPD